MNEFIELRNESYNLKNTNDFAFLFFDKFLSKVVATNDSHLIKTRLMVEKMVLGKELKTEDIDQLFFLLGENRYLDRLIVKTLLKSSDPLIKKMVQANIKDIISNKKYNGEKLYHVIELCIECEIDGLTDQDLVLFFDEYKNLDIVAILIDYIDHFKRDGFKKYLYQLLNSNYPDSIKTQLVSVLVNKASKEERDQIKLSVKWEELKLFYNDYIDGLSEKFVLKSQGLFIVQSMFYGDFEDSGKGNNGGLAVLLKNLGNEMAGDSRVSLVLTIALCETLEKPFITNYGNQHVYIRLPFYRDKFTINPFIKRELALKRQVGNFLKRLDLIPDIFHIRYLDNASQALADLCKEWQKKLVVTLTPDPHRTMVDDLGKLRHFNVDEWSENLNKIKIGDDLFYKSDGIIGIGDKKAKEELEMYFPQLKEKTIEMIGEGIPTKRLANGEFANPNQAGDLGGLPKTFFERPIILNVGRLASQKGQTELLKAWVNSKLKMTDNLLIIGGDLEEPSDEEKMIIDFFENYLQPYPYLKNHFFHQAAMPNDQVRCLENRIIKNRISQNNLGYPDLYLCASKKEEFGIAILEAMSQGFLILGPVKGGVKTYIENRVNGFLIDTSNWKTIARDAEKYLYDLGIDQEEFKKIQNAGQKTVVDHFSMKKIAHEFVTFYQTLKGVEKNEI